MKSMTLEHYKVYKPQLTFKQMIIVCLDRRFKRGKEESFFFFFN